MTKHGAMEEPNLSRTSREFSQQEISGGGAFNRPEVSVPNENSTIDLTNYSVSLETSSANSAIDKK